MGRPSGKTAPSSTTSTKEPGSEADGDEGWRVLLLRALVTGDVEVTARVLHDHIDVLSLPFTKSMPEWKVQWESLYWWMLRDATPLFIASAYSHPMLVQWLLVRGADRTFKCYLHRTPLDFVGECCETVMTKTSATLTAAVLERSEACRKLLTAPSAVPAPPMENVRFVCHVSSQIIMVKAPPQSSSSSSASTMRGSTAKPTTPIVTQQTIYKCLVEVTWEAPHSNGALIEKYEVRHRLLAEDRGGAIHENGGANSSGGSSWRLERASHNRKTRDQRLVIENLQFGSTYEVMLRAWNAAGKGDWGRAYKCHTLASPEQAAV